MAQSVHQLSHTPAALIFKELRRNTFPILASNLMGFALNFMELYYVSYLGKTVPSGVMVAVTWTTMIFSLALFFGQTITIPSVSIYGEILLRKFSMDAATPSKNSCSLTSKMPCIREKHL